MDTLSKYHKLAEILDFDLYKVATAIQRIHATELYHSSVLSDLENASHERIEKFTDTIDELLSMSNDTIKETAKDVRFVSVECYVKYLQGLLEINGVVFCKFCENKKTKKELKILEGLF